MSENHVKKSLSCVASPHLTQLGEGVLQIISPLLSKVRARGKNLLKYASTSSSQLLTDPYGRDSNQLAAMSLRENGNNNSLITYGLTPFSLTVLAILKNMARSSFGSSLVCLVNWFCCTMVIRASFNSKLFTSMGGFRIAEYSSLVIGLQKSSIVLYLY